MIDVRRLLEIKANIETAMQRDIDPLMRVVMQRRLDRVCAELNKLFEPQEIDQLNQRMAELEASNAGLLEALEDLIDECGQAEDCGLIDWKVMGKARDVAHKERIKQGAKAKQTPDLSVPMEPMTNKRLIELLEIFAYSESDKQNQARLAELVTKEVIPRFELLKEEECQKLMKEKSDRWFKNIHKSFVINMSDPEKVDATGIIRR